MLTRLEKTLYRLEAQHACLQWAFEQISGHPGVVFEIGLGLGRTFNHMRHHLGDRDIYAFERKVNAYPDCMPDEEHLIIGEIEETLPTAAKRFEGQVILGHSDIGSFDRESNRHLAGIISRSLPQALAPDAIVMSDLPLDMPGFEPLPLPPGAREDRYYLYGRSRG
jgi:hypothetical protein